MRPLGEAVGNLVTPDAPQGRATQPERRHSRAQFGLKTLFGLMLLVCLASGWLSFKIQHRRNQRQATTAIEQMGGVVICTSWTRHEWLDSLLGDNVFLEATAVWFTPDSPVDDDGLAWLNRFPELCNLNLSGTRITDAGLVHLRELTGLQSLELSDTRVSDAGLVHVANLSQIDDLDLSGTRITNACLDQLAGMPGLWTVDLTRTQVTHAGIVERFGPQGPPFFVAY